MRLLIVTRVLPHHSIGGMQAVAWDLAREFARLGHEVAIITAEISDRPDTFWDSGVEIRGMKGVAWRRYGERWRRGLLDACPREYLLSFDAILGVSSAASPFLDLGHDVRKRIHMQAHGTSFGELVSKWRSRRAIELIKSLKNLVNLIKDLRDYPRYASVVAIGQAVVTEFGRFPIALVLSGERGACLISNGVSEETFRYDSERALRLRESMGWWNSKVVVTAARLDGQKGIYQALDGIAVALRDDCSVRYLIVGDGPERVRLQSKVRELGLEDFVHFAGAVSRDEMVDYLSAADVMLFTTVRVEGLPMNILEALACGLPCIVSRHVVQQERPSEAIEEVDPHDPASVARAVKVIQPRMDRTSLLPERYSLQYAALSYLNLFSGASRSKGEVQ